MTASHYLVNPYYTLLAALSVILTGQWLTAKINFLQRYCIPEAITGGLIGALLLFLLHQNRGIELEFNSSLKDFCMLAFFASIGLAADFTSLFKGGVPLVLLTALSAVLVIIQNIIGIGSTYFFSELQPLHGLVLGSIPLMGGPSTASSWGGWFESQYHLAGAGVISMAAATYGLIAGGILGGPVASRLLQKINKPVVTLTAETAAAADNNQPEHRLITVNSTLTVLALLAVCVSSAFFITDYLNSNFPASKLRVPPFVWALFTGIILRNILTHGFNYAVFDRNIEVIGNVALELFLAIALVSMQLWQLSGLGIIILFILLLQTVITLLYIYFITFNVMGRDYDAVVICSGQVGFALGATPNAIANMQTLSEHHGASPKAFLIIPLVGAFFIDIINTIIITCSQIILT